MHIGIVNTYSNLSTTYPIYPIYPICRVLDFVDQQSPRTYLVVTKANFGYQETRYMCPCEAILATLVETQASMDVTLKAAPSMPYVQRVRSCRKVADDRH